nr:uncharacterized protein LOC115266047 [Aedes albopictus]
MGSPKHPIGAAKIFETIHKTMKIGRQVSIHKHNEDRKMCVKERFIYELAETRTTSELPARSEKRNADEQVDKKRIARNARGKETEVEATERTEQQPRRRKQVG